MALVIVSAIREIIGAGTLLGMRVLPASYEPALIFIMSAGAFFTLAFVVAGMNKILAVIKKKKEVK